MLKKRVLGEIQAMLRDSNEQFEDQGCRIDQMYIFWDPDNIGNLRVIIIPIETCYQNTVYEFSVSLDKYPMKPPTVIVENTGSRRTHPNFYARSNGGKVCLSILGTWAGPSDHGWTPTCTLPSLFRTILLTLQTDNPLSCEPSYGSISVGDPNNVAYCDAARYLSLDMTLAWYKTAFKDSNPFMASIARRLYVEHREFYISHSSREDATVNRSIHGQVDIKYSTFGRRIEELDAIIEDN